VTGYWKHLLKHQITRYQWDTSRELYLSQGNARLKELKEQGYEFIDMGRDEHGFKLHKLIYEQPGREKGQYGEESKESHQTSFYQVGSFR